MSTSQAAGECFARSQAIAHHRLTFFGTILLSSTAKFQLVHLSEHQVCPRVDVQGLLRLGSRDFSVASQHVVLVVADHC
jgi:hypothetical protein